MKLYYIILGLPAILLALVIHEFSHALAASMLGDNTAKFNNRLSLDPRDHLDLTGTIILVTTFIISGGRFIFGWAKPVPINTYNLPNPKRDAFLISLAGPASNLILAYISSILLKIISIKIVITFLYILAMINISLAVFNLLPIPPLDGFHILEFFIDENTAYKLEEFVMRYNLIIWLIIIFTPILQFILYPPIIFFYKLFGLY